MYYLERKISFNDIIGFCEKENATLLAPSSHSEKGYLIETIFSSKFTNYKLLKRNYLWGN